MVRDTANVGGCAILFFRLGSTVGLSVCVFSLGKALLAGERTF